MRRRLPLFIGALLLGAILYIPARREALNRGWLPSGTFVSADGTRITIYGNGSYAKVGPTGKKDGRFITERFPDIPYVSLLRLDSGEMLHVRYDNRAHWLDEVADLSSAESTYRRQ